MGNNASPRNVMKGSFCQPKEIARRVKNLLIRLLMVSIVSLTCALEGRNLISRVNAKNVKNILHQRQTEKSAKIIAKEHRPCQKMVHVKASTSQFLKNYFMKQDVQISQECKKMGNVDLMNAGKLKRSLSSVAARLVMTFREHKAHTMKFVDLMFAKLTNNFFLMESARLVRHTLMLVMTRKVAKLSSAKRIIGTLTKTGIASIVRHTLTDLIC
jgi:azurin